MNKSKFLFFLLAVSLANICFGVMPPKYFLERERTARIKAIAIVKNVKARFYNNKTGIETQNVTFETVTPLADGNIPKIFSGYCYSSVKQTGYIGGEKYYYPKESLGKHVYVAVSHDGGRIAAFKSVSKKEINKLINQFKSKNLLLGQINIKDRVNSISINFKDLYLFKIKGKTKGYLEYQKNDSYPQRYEAELYFQEDESLKKYSAKTSYSGNAAFQLNEIDLRMPDNICVITFKYNRSKKPSAGILRKSGEYPAAKNTVSDFALFNIVTLLPFDKKQTLHFTLIESFELNIKKGMKLKFAGPENGFFKFVQLDDNGHCVACYWLDEQHVLLRVAWGNDKLFIKTNNTFILTTESPEPVKN